MNYVTRIAARGVRAASSFEGRIRNYLGGSDPGAASSMGKVTAPEGVVSVDAVDAFASGVVVAALFGAGA